MADNRLSRNGKRRGETIMRGNLIIPMLFLISNTLKGDVKSLFSSLLTLTPYSLLLTQRIQP
jgi:hypothetical protein